MVQSAADQQVIDNVAAYGWHCMNVGAGAGEPNFSYSVGWWETIHSPEAIVFGLPSKLQHSMLWELFRQIQSGLVLVEGAKVSDLIEGCGCVVRSVHQSHISAYFGFALWYRWLRQGPHATVQAFQIFWPGKYQGLFPWEPDCDPAVRDEQPLLYLPRVSGVV